MAGKDKPKVSRRKIGRKLTTKLITGMNKVDIRKFAEDGGGKARHLYTVFGKAGGVVTGESDNGPWTAFRGQFKAVNHDGTEHVGSRLFLEKGAEDALLGVLQGPEATGVEFAFEIYVTYDETAVTEYVYSSEALMVEDENEKDPLAEMQAKLGISSKPVAIEDKSKETKAA